MRGLRRVSSTLTHFMCSTLTAKLGRREGSAMVSDGKEKAFWMVEGEGMGIINSIKEKREN